MGNLLDGAIGMGKGVGTNLGMSGLMYGAMGTLSYDSSQTDPLNQTVKMGLGLAADQVQDAGIMAGGTAATAGYSGLQKLGMPNFGKVGSRMVASAEAGMVAEGATTVGRVGNFLKGGVGMAGKAADFGLRHATKVGMGAVMAAAFFATDLGMIATDFYDHEEAKYRRMKSHPGFQLSQSSSRFIQDQLQSMRGAGHEAEIMHN